MTLENSRQISFEPRPKSSRSGLKPERKLFNHRVCQDLTRNPLHLGLRGALFQSILQSQQKILSLPHIGNAAIFHSPQCICNRLPLGIQHRSFQRDIDMSLHLV
jgi:hypothetical protein